MPGSSSEIHKAEKLLEARKGEKMLESTPGMKNARKFDRVGKGQGARKG